MLNIFSQTTELWVKTIHVQVINAVISQTSLTCSLLITFFWSSLSQQVARFNVRQETWGQHGYEATNLIQYMVCPYSKLISKWLW